MNNLNDNEETVSGLIKRKNEEMVYKELFYPTSSENRVFSDIKIPYRIMFNLQNKETIYKMVLDHLLFSCAKESVNILLKRCRFLNKNNVECKSDFIHKYRHIFEMIEQEREFDNIMVFFNENFKLKTEIRDKFIDSIIKYDYLKMLLTKDGQETFNLFKQKLKKFKFEIDTEIFSLVGFAKTNSVHFQKYVNQETIDLYKLRMKSILWESEYNRKESFAMTIIDRWIINEM